MVIFLSGFPLENNESICILPDNYMTNFGKDNRMSEKIRIPL